MIRFANKHDTKRVIELWKQCFPEDEAFTEWFFAQIYQSELALLDEENGELTAMLQMLPYTLRDARGERAVTYIYGACTAPAFRRQHRMDRLLNASFAWDKENRRVASILIPQEEWLFDFYRKFGYETVFYTATKNVVQQAVTKQAVVRRVTAADIPRLNQLYETEKVQLLRTDRDWLDQLELFDALGVGVFGLEQDDCLTTYAFVWQDGAEKLWIQEAAGDGIDSLCQTLLQHFNCTTLRVTSAGNGQKLGCIRYHDDTLPENGYFNLLFN